MIGALGRPPQFDNFFLNPYLSGTYAYETFKPYDNLFLNSSLLTQDIASRQERAGIINNDIGASILGPGLFNSLFGGPTTASLLGMGFGGGIPGGGGQQAPGDVSTSSIDRLIELLEGLRGAEADEGAEEPPADDSPNAGDNPPEDYGNMDILRALMGGGGGLSSLMGGFGGLGAFMNPLASLMNPFSIFGGLGGDPSSAILAGGNPLPSFSPFIGPFANAPNQNPGFPALATLDPVIRSSLFSETASPIFGNILANGGLPPFRSQFFI